MKIRRRRAAILFAVLLLSTACSASAPNVAPQVSLPKISDENLEYMHDYTLDVYRPTAASENAPVVVALHGCCGDRADLAPLAEAFAKAGAVVFNVTWPGIQDNSGYEIAYGAVHCALLFAEEYAEDYGGDSARLALLGWSDGALVGGVIALRGSTPRSASCLARTQSGRPELFVAVGGFFGWQVPVEPKYVTQQAVTFFGGTPSTAAQAWHDATPYSWLGTGPSLPMLLLASTEDALVEDTQRFSAALRSSEEIVRTVYVPPSGDTSMISPRTLEGRTTVGETMRALQHFPALPAGWPVEMTIGRTG